MFLKKLLRVIGKTIAVIIMLICIYLLAAISLSYVSVGKEPFQSDDVAIYILTNGDHTDIIVPVKNSVKDWRKEIKYENTTSRDTTAQYIAIGWGDKGFYLNTPTWSQLKFSVAFKAAFGLSTSAMHTTFTKEVHEYSSCKRIMLSNQQYTRLVTYIDNSFKRTPNGDVINIITDAHYDQYDSFYEANYTYSMFYTCNTWANDALKACGQKACLWTPFDVGIFRQYK